MKHKKHFWCNNCSEIEGRERNYQSEGLSNIFFNVSEKNSSNILIIQFEIISLQQKVNFFVYFELIIPFQNKIISFYKQKFLE